MPCRAGQHHSAPSRSVPLRPCSVPLRPCAAPSRPALRRPPPSLRRTVPSRPVPAPCSAVPAPSRTVQRLINAFRISLRHRHRRQRLPSLCATYWGAIGSAGFWTRLSSGLAEMLGIEGSLGESDECEHRGKRGDFVANAGCLGPHRAHDDPPTRSPSGPSRTPSRSDAAGLRRSKRDSRWADHEGRSDGAIDGRSDGAIDGAISLDPPI